MEDRREIRAVFEPAGEVLWDVARLVEGGGSELGRFYSCRYSRNRFVCVRLTGISVDLGSFIRRM